MIMAPGRCCKHKKISRYIQLQITGRKNESVVYLIHTYIPKLYLSSDFSVAYKLVSPILITNFKRYNKNKAKKRKKKFII